MNFLQTEDSEFRVITCYGHTWSMPINKLEGGFEPYTWKLIFIFHRFLSLNKWNVCSSNWEGYFLSRYNFWCLIHESFCIATSKAGHLPQEWGHYFFKHHSILTCLSQQGSWSDKPTPLSFPDIQFSVTISFSGRAGHKSRCQSTTTLFVNSLNRHSFQRVSNFPAMNPQRVPNEPCFWCSCPVNSSFAEKTSTKRSSFGFLNLKD